MNETKAQTNPQPNSIDQLRSLGDQLSQNYNPMFKKYLDKALQNAQPQEVQAQPGRLVPDPQSFASYVAAIEKAKKVVEFSKVSNKLLQDLYKKQSEIKEVFTQFSAVVAELKPFVNEAGRTVTLTEDSGDLVNTMNELIQTLEQNVNDIKVLSEEAFDSIQPMGL